MIEADYLLTGRYWPRYFWPFWYWGEPDWKTDVVLSDAAVNGVALADAAVNGVSITTATR